MLYRVVPLVIVALLLPSTMAAQAQSQPPQQTPAQMQQVLQNAQQKNKAVKVTLKQKIENHRKFSGGVSDISDTGFTLTDRKTGRAMKLTYADVDKVKRKGMSKGAKIAIGVTAGALLAGFIVLESVTD